jgi:cytochrome o ubiquinol oxidase subunit 1
MQHYDVAEWRPWLLVAAAGAVIIMAGIGCQVVQLVVSIRQRQRSLDLTGDPWDGRSLEWATASPPPAFNFAIMPDVSGEEPYWTIKEAAFAHHELRAEPNYEAIEVPRNTPTGVVTAFFATLVGFAMIWHIWWMALLGLAGAFATFVAFAWSDRSEDLIPAAEVARLDRANRAARTVALTQRRPAA